MKFKSSIAIATGAVLCALLFLLSSPCGAQGQSRQLQQLEPVKAWPSKAKRWALVIGVDKYRDPQISPLKGSDNDAHTLADALVRYAGFPSDQVILMATDQPEERQPSRVNILRRLSNFASVVPKDGLLVVSFAGHGMERNGQAFLLPTDAQISEDVSFLEETAVSVARIKDRIRATGVGQVIFLLDACRNDPGGRADAPNQLTQGYVNAFNFDVRNREVQAFATFYATAVGQRAYEYTERKQGYFTWAIVEGLKGAAANQNGEVTLAGLVSYVQATVPKRIGIDLGAGKQQRPFAIIEGYRADDLVIAVAGQVAAVPVTTASSLGPPTDASAVELAYWDAIKNSNDPKDFQAFLEKFPDGNFAAPARKRLSTALTALPAGATSPIPTIEQMLERHVQAIGGKPALEKLTTRVTKGSFVQILGQTNLTATFESYQKAPNKTLYINSAGTQQGFNGAIGWIKNNGKLRNVTGEQLAQMKRGSDFYGSTKLSELYAKISFVRMDKVGSHDVYVFEATPSDGKPHTLFFDTQTALLLRSDSYLEAQKGKPEPTETYYEDYREVDGIKLPFTQRQVGSAYTITLKVYEVKHNIPIDDVKFDGPSKH
ncbi:MAG TPA: caspase family protein [Pyrinomonadaceae bacterium]|nr:caspase family protein [Pyrinomonadaceae bacterium]